MTNFNDKITVHGFVMYVAGSRTAGEDKTAGKIVFKSGSPKVLSQLRSQLWEKQGILTTPPERVEDVVHLTQDKATRRVLETTVQMGTSWRRRTAYYVMSTVKEFTAEEIQGLRKAGVGGQTRAPLPNIYTGASASGTARTPEQAYYARLQRAERWLAEGKLSKNEYRNYVTTGHESPKILKLRSDAAAELRSIAAARDALNSFPYAETEAVIRAMKAEAEEILNRNEEVETLRLAAATGLSKDAARMRRNRARRKPSLQQAERARQRAKLSRLRARDVQLLQRAEDAATAAAEVLKAAAPPHRAAAAESKEYKKAVALKERATRQREEVLEELESLQTAMAQTQPK